MPTLYHHTCQHAAAQIDTQGGLLLPTPQAMLEGRPLLWLTTLAAPARTMLGLTSYLLDCDRTSCTYQLDAPVDAHSWAMVRSGMPRAGVIRLEAARGTKPALWWVTDEPQLAVRIR
jgi:hypothetical protein